jgi:pimeloyl-ACP methyl ester carboxylesterase
VVRLLDHVGIDRAHIVGYSMGAQIVGKLRSLHPERFLSMCIGGAGWVFFDGPEPWHFLLADSLERGEGFMSLYDVLYPDWTPERREGRSKESVAGLADILATSAMLRGWDFAVTEASLRANTVPTLAIIGAVDPMKPTVDALQGVMRNLETVVIPDADHLSVLEHPDYVANIVSFLKRHPAN